MAPDLDRDNPLVKDLWEPYMNYDSVPNDSDPHLNWAAEGQLLGNIQALLDDWPLQSEGFWYLLSCYVNDQCINNVFLVSFDFLPKSISVRLLDSRFIFVLYNLHLKCCVSSTISYPYHSRIFCPESHLSAFGKLLNEFKEAWIRSSMTINLEIKQIQFP